MFQFFLLNIFLKITPMTNQIYKPFDYKNKEPVIISSHNISLTLDRKLILDKLTFKTKSNKISFLMGPNGAGKTLCLKIISGIIKPSIGNILFSKKVRIGYVPQKVIFLRRSIYDNLVYVMKLYGFSSKQIKKRILTILSLTQFENEINISARKISVGKQQLLAIIRALIIKPNLLLLDEPCSNLDPNYTLLIEEILRKASKQGVKILLVTHDLFQARRLSEEIIFINKGSLVEQSQKKDFFEKPQSRIAKDYISGKLPG